MVRTIHSRTSRWGVLCPEASSSPVPSALSIFRKPKAIGQLAVHRAYYYKLYTPPKKPERRSVRPSPTPPQNEPSNTNKPLEPKHKGKAGPDILVPWALIMGGFTLINVIILSEWEDHKKMQEALLEVKRIQNASRNDRFKPRALPELEWRLAIARLEGLIRRMREEGRNLGEESEWLVANFTASQENLKNHRYHTLLTHAFSHHSAEHFRYNLYALAIATAMTLKSGHTPATVLLVSCASAVFSGLLSCLLGAPDVSGTGASGLLCGLQAFTCCARPLHPLSGGWAFGRVGLQFLAATGFISDLKGLWHPQVSEKGELTGHKSHIAGAVFGAACALATRALPVRQFMKGISQLRWGKPRVQMPHARPLSTSTPGANKTASPKAPDLQSSKATSTLPGAGEKKNKKKKKEEK